LNQERKDARIIRIEWKGRESMGFCLEPGKEGCKDNQDRVERKKMDGDFVLNQERKDERMIRINEHII